MPSGFFITGTDTGVGKTLAACALLRAFTNAGKSTIGMKPVAAGCEPHGSRLHCDDVEYLRQAGSVQAPHELVCPYAFAPAIAPHLAAEQQGIDIALSRIVACYQQLCTLAEVVIVEGVGGFRVPLNARQDTADLSCQLNLPVILVVGIRLGCLNHALLSAQAITATGLPFAGWIANQIDPAMLMPSENIQALAERLPAPLLASIPYHSNPVPDQLSRRIDLTKLI